MYIAREAEEGDSIRDVRSSVSLDACVTSQRETLARLLGAGGVGC